MLQIAVERVTELLQTPQEPPQIIESNRPPALWPSSTGGIVFENVSVSYAEKLPNVIKNVSFEVAPRSKVGVVGRTGSGKVRFRDTKKRSKFSVTLKRVLRLIHSFRVRLECHYFDSSIHPMVVSL